MSSRIKIPLTESQKNLLQQKELTSMVEPEMKIALSGILSKDNKFYLDMEFTDMVTLIEMICIVANHEVTHPKIVKEYDRLVAYLYTIPR